MFSFTSLGVVDISAQNFLLLIILILSLTIHEWAHAFCADKLDDPLPREEGRVTLDPRAHIDPIGSLLIPCIMIFFHPGFMVMGWGKPVNISLPNSKTRTRDDYLITLAGPFSNLMIAILVTIIFGFLNKILPISEQFMELLELIVNLNCLLFLFNLIPIPPLDGSHILKRLLKINPYYFSKFSNYGIIVLLLLINFDPFISFLYETHSILTTHLGKFFSLL